MMSESLKEYGLDGNLLKECGSEEFSCARVVSVHHSDYELQTGKGRISALLPGRWKREKDPTAFPAVGDWVLYEEKSDTALIQTILPRKNLLTRKKRHWAYPKPIAANLDGVVLVQAFGRDLNFRRMQRIFTLLIAQGFSVSFVFNKVDLVTKEERDRVTQQLRSLGVEADTFFTSTKTGEGMDELQKLFLPRKTYTLLGSSGVGKTSIVNALFGEEVFATQETMKTGKGKHTTTVRRLVRVPGGALLIDTPGTRDFSIEEYVNEVGDEAFPLIHQYAQYCKFRDCTHQHEPGCAVREALERGEIERSVYDDYLHFIQHATKNSPKQKR